MNITCRTIFCGMTPKTAFFMYDTIYTPSFRLFCLTLSAPPCYHRPGPVAQWLEQATHNRLVAGSSPAGAISQKKRTISVRFFVLYSRRGENEVRKWATAPNGRSRSER